MWIANRGALGTWVLSHSSLELAVFSGFGCVLYACSKLAYRHVEDVSCCRRTCCV